MTDQSLLGPWVRRFLLEYLVGDRNLARNTQLSYRDTLRQLLPFTAKRARRAARPAAASRISRRSACAPFCVSWESNVAVGPRRRTSVWRPSTPWPISSAYTARNTSSGMGRSVQFR